MAKLVVILGLLIGAIVGVIDTVFGRVLLWIGDFRNLHLNELLPFLGIVGIGIVVGYQKFAGKAARGMTQVFMVSQESEENIPLRLIPFVTVATSFWRKRGKRRCCSTNWSDDGTSLSSLDT